MLSPIILFVYNRPWHTQQTLDALANNTLSVDSTLYIFCDGLKENSKEEEILKIFETREIAKSESRFKEVHIIEHTINKGLANSIIDGVSEIVNKFGRVIVLEDDIITSPGFLKYMNDALNVYQDIDKVMHISGYMFPVQEKMSETFFIQPTSCWGWGTWSRAWLKFEKKSKNQIDLIAQKGWNKFTINGSNPAFKNHLEMNLNGNLNTWAIFWYASVYLNDGVSLHPYPSLVQNIGFDGSGVHCDREEDFKNPYINRELAKSINVVKKNKFTNKKELLSIELFYRRINNLPKEFNLRDRFYLLRKKIIKKIFK
jgi:hypothetical protein